MSKKYVSLFLTFILSFTTLYSCASTSSSKAQDANLPYYSITTEYVSRENNYYMELDVRIPKITYSGIESDELFDSINMEIYSKLSNLIEEAKVQALNTYNTYLETARSNMQKEIDTKLSELDIKYKEVLDSTNVNGFTGTDVVIDPNLHNKNIIVVETTAPAETASKSNIPRSGDAKDDNRFIEPSNSNRGEKPNFNREWISTKSNATNPKAFQKPDENNRIVNKSSTSMTSKTTESEIDKELTIDDYYKELAEINRMTQPSDRELMREYTPTKILCNFDVKCLDEDYISLLVELSEIKTAPTIKRFFYNIDLHSKKMLAIKDVLGDNYKDLCVDKINSSIENFSDEEKANLKSDYNIEDFVNDDIAFFINNNHVPVIELDKFTLTPSYLEFPVAK